MKYMDCVAIVLPARQEKKSRAFAMDIPKAAVTFGGRCRRIDFALSNCIRSNICTIGVLTQHQNMELSRYIGAGTTWRPENGNGGITVLPPRTKAGKREYYKSIANAIVQNADFIDRYNPKNILVLTGDHLYKMYYDKMLNAHKSAGAAVTMSVLEVPWHRASRFDGMKVSRFNNSIDDERNRQYYESNLASMGIYIFDWEILKKYLMMDKNSCSDMDFANDIIPKMLSCGETMSVYRFDDYWEDADTIYNLWEANMNLLSSQPSIYLYDDCWDIINNDKFSEQHFVSENADVKSSFVAKNCEIHGMLKKSIISSGAYVGEGAEIVESVIMPNARIGDGAVVHRAIVGCNATIGACAGVGIRGNLEDFILVNQYQRGITIVRDNANIDNYVDVPINFMADDTIENRNSTPYTLFTT